MIVDEGHVQISFLRDVPEARYEPTDTASASLPVRSRRPLGAGLSGARGTIEVYRAVGGLPQRALLGGQLRAAEDSRTVQVLLADRPDDDPEAPTCPGIARPRPRHGPAERVRRRGRRHRHRPAVVRRDAPGRPRRRTTPSSPPSWPSSLPPACSSRRCVSGPTPTTTPSRPHCAPSPDGWTDAGRSKVRARLSKSRGAVRGRGEAARTSGGPRPEGATVMTTTSYVDPRTLSATARDAAKAAACADPRTRVTRSLAGYGVIAGPVYVGVSLAQAAHSRRLRPRPALLEPAGDRRLGLDPDRQPRRDRPDVARLLGCPAPNPGGRPRWPGRARPRGGVRPRRAACGRLPGRPGRRLPRGDGHAGDPQPARDAAPDDLGRRLPRPRRRDGRHGGPVCVGAPPGPERLLGRGRGRPARWVRHDRVRFGGWRRGVHDRHHHGADLADPARLRTYTRATYARR